MTIMKRGQEWEVLKIYDKFILCKNPIGYNECFNKLDIFTPLKVHKNERLFHIEGKPYTTNQIMKQYELTRAQVIYRYRVNKPLPDGRFVVD